MFNKALETAFSAMAALSVNHDKGLTITATEIAKARNLNRPFLAKQLTALSQAGLVASKPGPKGGFCLARPPAEITLLQIADAVGYHTKIECCPFEAEHAPDAEHCPLHNQVVSLRDQLMGFLENNTLETFTQTHECSDPKGLIQL